MPEIFTTRFSTTLTSAVSVTTRPTTIAVAATQAVYGTGTYSIAIYDVGTDASPTHYEVLEVTAGGATLTWTVTNEAGYTPVTHASGSTVIATILSTRAIQQPMVDHVTPATTPDPHSGYIRKVAFANKGDLLVGTGSGTSTGISVGADGTSPLADSTAPSGIRWSALGLQTVLLHVGDLVMGGLQGLATRLGVGSLGQALIATQNAAAVANPLVAPTCAAVGSSGSLVNGTVYDFAYAWQTSVVGADGGDTIASPVTTFTATSTGVVSVQCPAAPASTLTLLVYAALHSGALQLQGSVTNASTSSTNTVLVSSLISGVAPSATNTTGGISPGWGTVGTVTSVSMASPAEFTVSGSPITSSGTFTMSKTNQSAATIYAGPATGAATTPGFRAMLLSDLPVQAYHEEFSPTTSATTTALLHPINTLLMVAVNGAVLRQTVQYSFSGAVVTFVTPFTTGDHVVISYIGQTGISATATLSALAVQTATQ